MFCAVELYNTYYSDTQTSYHQESLKLCKIYPMTQKSLVCGLMCFGDFIKIDFINSFCCVRIYDVYMMPFKNTSENMCAWSLLGG